MTQNYEERIQPYREFIYNNTISYEIVDEDMIETYPLISIKQSKTNKLAMLILPTHDGKILTGDLTESIDASRNTVLRVITEAKKRLVEKGIDVPLMVCQVRLVFTPKTGKKQLALNRYWLF